MSSNRIPNGGSNMALKRSGGAGVLNSAQLSNPTGVNRNPHGDGPMDFRSTDWSDRGTSVKVDTGGYSAGRAGAAKQAGLNNGLGAGTIGQGQGPIFQSTGANPRRGV